jgi:serine/threonine protein kinase
MERTITIPGFTFAIHELLGSGAHGKVYRGTNLASGEACALKFFDLPAAKRAADVEIAAVASLSGGPHIVKLIATAREVMKPRKRRVDPRRSDLLVTEFCARGSLIETLIASSRLSEAASRTYFLQLLNAVAYAHSRNVVHRCVQAPVL